MAVPVAVRFDRLSQLTTGLNFIELEPPIHAGINSVALVTGWLASGLGVWTYCYNAISVTWTLCYSDPVTTWTPVSQPSTTWTPV